MVVHTFEQRCEVACNRLTEDAEFGRAYLEKPTQEKAVTVSDINVYTLEQRFAIWACDRLTKDADFGKKSCFQMKLILILAGM